MARFKIEKVKAGWQVRDISADWNVIGVYDNRTDAQAGLAEYAAETTAKEQDIAARLAAFRA